MQRVKRSAIVSYSADQMFGLVDDVEAYPDFMPWCSGARIHERSESDVIASLELAKGGVSKWFTTKNLLQRPNSIELQLVGGPFSHLQGGWQFRALGESGSEVSLDISFEFSSVLMTIMLGGYFEQTCGSLVQAFVERARAVYRE